MHYPKSRLNQLVNQVFEKKKITYRPYIFLNIKINLKDTITVVSQTKFQYHAIFSSLLNSCKFWKKKYKDTF